MTYASAAVVLVAAAASVVLHAAAQWSGLSRIDVPLTIGQDLRYLIGVNMSYGANTQRFKFALAANTGFSAVAGIACQSCNNVAAYNASASTSESPLPGSGNVSLGLSTISGSLMKEDCALQQLHGLPWVYENQTLINVNSSSSMFSGVTSGLIGLGTFANGQTGDYLNTVFGQWFSTLPNQTNFTFGMALNPARFTNDNDLGNGGLLHMQGADSSAHLTPVSWNTAIVSASVVTDNSTNGTTSGTGNTTPNVGPSVSESDWTISLDSWSAAVSGATVGSSNSTLAIIEPFFSDILLPSSAAGRLYQAVPSASQLSSLVNGSLAWSVPCNTNIQINFTFNGTSFPLDSSRLVVPLSDGTCLGAIKGWASPFVSVIMLGSNFISNYYLIFVVGKPGSGVQSQVGISHRAIVQKSSSNAGAIAGGTIGGVAGLSALLLGAFWFGRRTRNRNRSAIQEEAAAAAAPFDAFPATPSSKGRFSQALDDVGYTDKSGMAQHGVAMTPTTLVHSIGSGDSVKAPGSISSRPALSMVPEIQGPMPPALDVPRSARADSESYSMAPSLLAPSPRQTAYGTNAGEIGNNGPLGNNDFRISYNGLALGSTVSAANAAAQLLNPANPTTSSYAQRLSDRFSRSGSDSMTDSRPASGNDYTVEPFVLQDSARHWHAQNPSGDGSGIGEKASMAAGAAFRGPFALPRGASPPHTADASQRRGKLSAAFPGAMAHPSIARSDTPAPPYSEASASFSLPDTAPDDADPHPDPQSGRRSENYPATDRKR